MAQCGKEYRILDIFWSIHIATYFWDGIFVRTLMSFIFCVCVCWQFFSLPLHFPARTRGLTLTW